jgi:hypothetical protein
MSTVRLSPLLAVLMLAACSPALNWREVRPEGSGALAMFPCKPSHEVRHVVLAGMPLEMAVVACHAADAMFGLGYADVGDPTRVAAALQALAQAAGANLGAASVEAPLQVPGMTPQPAAQALSLKGQLPDGRHVQGRVAVFAKGTRVYQATVFGPQLDDDAPTAFFGGLRLQS